MLSVKVRLVAPTVFFASALPCIPGGGSCRLQYCHSEYCRQEKKSLFV